MPLRNEDTYFRIFFFLTRINILHFPSFQYQVIESEEKINFGSRRACVPMNPPPQSKLRGDTLVYYASRSIRLPFIALLFSSLF